MKTFEMTELSALILSTLTQPIHGYDIMKVIESDLGDYQSIGPATLYTTLSKLLKAKLCTYTVDGKKKVYTITPLGRDVLHREIQKHEKMVTFMKEMQLEG